MFVERAAPRTGPPSRPFDMSSTPGAIYIARERQALEPKPIAAAVNPYATARLFECAAHHDGQPARDWLRAFLEAFNGRKAA